MSLRNNNKGGVKAGILLFLSVVIVVGGLGAGWIFYGKDLLKKTVLSKNDDLKEAIVKTIESSDSELPFMEDLEAANGKLKKEGGTLSMKATLNSLMGESYDNPYLSMNVVSDVAEKTGYTDMVLGNKKGDAISAEAFLEGSKLYAYIPEILENACIEYDLGEDIMDSVDTEKIIDNLLSYATVEKKGNTDLEMGDVTINTTEYNVKIKKKDIDELIDTSLETYKETMKESYLSKEDGYEEELEELEEVFEKVAGILRALMDDDINISVYVSEEKVVSVRFDYDMDLKAAQDYINESDDDDDDYDYDYDDDYDYDYDFDDDDYDYDYDDDYDFDDDDFAFEDEDYDFDDDINLELEDYDDDDDYDLDDEDYDDEDVSDDSKAEVIGIHFEYNNYDGEKGKVNELEASVEIEGEEIKFIWNRETEDKDENIVITDKCKINVSGVTLAKMTIETTIEKETGNLKFSGEAKLNSSLGLGAIEISGKGTLEDADEKGYTYNFEDISAKYDDEEIVNFDLSIAQTTDIDIPERDEDADVITFEDLMGEEGDEFIEEHKTDDKDTIAKVEEFFATFE